MSQDRRGTLFEFGPSRKRSRPDENGDDAGDQTDTAVHETVNSRIVREPLLKQALNSSSAQASTRTPTRPSSAIINKLHIPQNQDPWKEFKPLLHVLQGGPAVLAHSIPPMEQLFAIRTVAAADKDKHLRGIQHLSLFPGRGIDHIRGIFDWAGKLFIVTEYVRPNLSQIITSEFHPTEAHPTEAHPTEAHLTEAHLAFIAHALIRSAGDLLPHQTDSLTRPRWRTSWFGSWTKAPSSVQQKSFMSWNHTAGPPKQ
ncbi:hypothetical protein LTR79_001740 [Exophiala xenobiotica]|nr:hypothetical protein LTR79_001740 [Exophiala xenobiotica]